MAGSEGKTGGIIIQVQPSHGNGTFAILQEAGNFKRIVRAGCRRVQASA